MTFREAVLFGHQTLLSHTCDHAHPVREAEALLSFATKKTKEQLILNAEKPVPVNALKKYKKYITARKRHTPLAHILGTAWFYGMEFAVNKSTLIPRPATEEIVSRIFLSDSRNRQSLPAGRHGVRQKNFIDVGTGSGAIAITLAKYFPQSAVIATDVSIAALRTARKNAKRNGVAERIMFKKTSIIDKRSLQGKNEKLCIIANLPYIPNAEWKKLSPCVRREPKSALLGGKDGLDYYRKLFEQLQKQTAQTTVFIEILPKQEKTMRAYITHLFPKAKIEPITNHQKKTVGLCVRIE